MVPADIIQKIKKVHIRTGRTVNTLMAGQYKSAFRGAGIEFEEVREYAPGDDVKSIDWKVSARLGRPFVKRYREEREMIVMLLVDLSASGRFGTQAAPKQAVAAETAAILAFNAIRNNDKVGAILFTDQVERYIPPQKGSGHVWRVIKEIFTHTPQHVGTDISGAVGFLGRVCRKRSVAFVISDFLLTGGNAVVDRQMRSVNRRHELIHILISDPGEFTLPEGGIVTVRELESGRLVRLDASHGPTRRRYEERRTEAHRHVKNEFKAANMDCIDISTAASTADVLARYFRVRERRRR
ncbi:DUF58 domain-containing protein [Desulfatitalea tepidiphila]|uniref:DUF58 domain-containing protein n=1 Tax=Desulfatitalea tepidiphila TaxID=1185843 RepID=UPI0006B560C6|nr:DUF58 domain-containing protein [Desulfatitalea tepidiphila]